MKDRDIVVVVSNPNKDVSAIETIDAIRNAGFTNVFIQWYNRDWKPTQEEQLEYIRKKGLNIIFAHLGYQNINNLWLEKEAGDKLVDRYKNDIKICRNNNIPMVIMHLTSKSEAPKYNEIGLKRLQEIVDYAKKLNIKVAFENTKIKGYLDYVIDNIKNKNVGICFDSGHYHVHFNDEFDGTLNWSNVVKNLKGCNYSGPLTLELCYRYEYLKMGINEFYKKGYEVGNKLKEMFEMDEVIV